MPGQGACEAGGTDGSGGEKNPRGKGGMQVFLVRKAVCFSISFFFSCLPKVPAELVKVKPAELMELAATWRRFVLSRFYLVILEECLFYYVLCNTFCDCNRVCL